jgi:hypothetical protein
MTVPSRASWLSIAALVALVGACTNAAADSRPAKVLLKKQTLFDPVVGKDAYSVLVPADWKMQGQVIWPAGNPAARYDLSVSNPATKAAWRHLPRTPYVSGLREARIRQAPGMRAQWESQWADGKLTPLGYEVRPFPASPRDYVLKILAPATIAEVANAQDLAVVSETDLPELAKTMASNDVLQRDFMCSRFRVQYTGADGPVEREFFATMVLDKPADGVRTWIGDVITYRAPKGQLDALIPLFTSISSSVTVQLPWFNVETQAAAAFMQHQQENERQILSDMARAAETRMAILHKYSQAASDQVSKQIHDNFAAQQSAKAAVQDKFMHYVNNTASFNNPNDSGSKLTLDAGYKFQYINNHGDVLQTDNPNLQPPVDPSTSWQALQRSP